MKLFKQIILLIMLAKSATVFANDTLKVDLSVGADVVNHYVWRGLMLSNSPSIQPTMGVTFGRFSFGSWASYSVNPSAFQEVDLFLTYSAGAVTVGFNDYYNPVDSLGFGDRYFNFGKKTTLHTLETFLTISKIGGTNFSATGALFVYGNDRDDDLKNLYSSYLELSYATKVKNYGLNFFCGATLNKGYYADNAAVVNLGASITKDIRISDTFTVPCKSSFIVNPDKQNVFLVLGFTF
jgi:hypothetical protein